PDTRAGAGGRYGAAGAGDSRFLTRGATIGAGAGPGDSGGGGGASGGSGSTAERLCSAAGSAGDGAKNRTLGRGPSPARGAGGSWPWRLSGRPAGSGRSRFAASRETAQRNRRTCRDAGRHRVLWRGGG